MGLDVVYVSGSKIPLNNYHLLEYDRDIYTLCKPSYQMLKLEQRGET
jgi:hypothetical protein